MRGDNEFHVITIGNKRGRKSLFSMLEHVLCFLTNTKHARKSLQRFRNTIVFWSLTFVDSESQQEYLELFV